MADAQTRTDIGPTDFGVPAEFAERARNYARWREAQAPAQLDRAVMQQALDALRDLEAMAERYHPSGYPVPDAQKKARAAIAALSASIGQVSEPRDG